MTTVFQTLMRNYSPHFTKKIIEAAKQGWFNRISQVAPMFPHLVHPNLHLHHTSSASCWVAFISTAMACPGPAPFCLQKCPFMCRDLDPHKVPWSHQSLHLKQHQQLLQASQSWQSDRQTYNVATAAMRPSLKIVIWILLYFSAETAVQ